MGFANKNNLFFVTFVKFLDSAACRYVSLTTGEEWVAFGAYVDAQFFFCGTRSKGVAATAGNFRLKKLRMNSVFHGKTSLSS